MATVSVKEVAKKIGEIKEMVGGFDSKLKFLSGGYKDISDASSAADK